MVSIHIFTIYIPWLVTLVTDVNVCFHRNVVNIVPHVFIRLLTLFHTTIYINLNVSCVSIIFRQLFLWPDATTVFEFVVFITHSMQTRALFTGLAVRFFVNSYIENKGLMTTIILEVFPFGTFFTISIFHMVPPWMNRVLWSQTFSPFLELFST